MDEVVRSLSLIATVLGLSVSALLLLGRSRGSGPRYLGWFLLLFSSVSLNRYLLHWNLEWSVWLALVLVPTLLYLGPLTFFYTRRTLFHSPPSARDLVRHAIPVGVMFAFHTTAHLLFWDEMNVEHIRARQGVSFVLIPAIILCIYVSLVGYAIVSLGLLRRYVHSVEENFAHDYRAQVAWLRIFLYAQLLGAAVHAPVVLASLFLPLGLPLNILDATLYTFFIFLLCYNLVKRPAVFQIHEEPRTPQSATEKYRKQSLDSRSRRNLLRKIQDFMEEEQAYLEENISLQEVASRLEIPAHHVSMSINSELGQNFYSFVNRYRLEEAMRMLADPDLARENVLSIAFRSGFQSKAAFNRIFKQHTSMSPRDYRLKALADS